MKKITMTKVILTLVISAIIATASQAAIVCKKNGRYWYPANDKSIKIAKMLGVKTCNGKRFKAVVKQLNETSNVVKARQNMSVSDVVKNFGK